MSILVGMIIMVVFMLYCIVAVKTSYDEDVDDKLQERAIEVVKNIKSK